MGPRRRLPGPPVRLTPKTAERARFSRLYGEKGGLELSHGHWGSLLRICTGADIATGTWREVKAEPVQTNYQRFAEAVRTGVQADPDFRHAAELQKILDLALVADLDRKEHRV